GDRHNPAKEIQVLVSLHVPQVLHAGVVCNQRVRVIRRDGREEILLVLFEDLVFGHGSLQCDGCWINCNPSERTGMKKEGNRARGGASLKVFLKACSTP